MLLDYDEYDTWENYIRDPGEVDGYDEDARRGTRIQRQRLRLSFSGTTGAVITQPASQLAAFHSRRTGLVEHYTKAKREGEITYYN